jgi:hypothetical protein
MNARIPSALCLGAALTLFSLPAANAQPSMDDNLATRQTIQDIRNVGTAMFAWYKDEMSPKRSEESHKKAEASAEAESADISAVPVISREDLAKVLVPKYIASIPEKDGWGNAYEFHLNTTDPNAVQVMGLRSTGKDGKFSGDVYVIGGFSPADAGQDISWMDGFFVRWPEAKPAPSPAQ